MHETTARRINFALRAVRRDVVGRGQRQAIHMMAGRGSNGPSAELPDEAEQELEGIFAS